MQRVGDAREPEIQRAVLYLIDAGSDGVGAAVDRIAVASVTEVRVRLVHGEEDARPPVVQRRLIPVSPLPVEHPVDRRPPETFSAFGSDHAIDAIDALHDADRSGRTHASREGSRSPDCLTP